MIIIHCSWNKQYLANGFKQLVVKLVNDGKVVDSRTFWSGSPTRQNEAFVHPSKDYAGSGRPIPEGIYKIGDLIKMGSPETGVGYRKIILGIHKRFNNRDEFLFHDDFNYTTNPGSMGCLVNSDPKAMDAVIAWTSSATASPEYLVVDWDTGALETIPLYNSLKTALTISPEKQEPQVEIDESRSGRSWNDLIAYYKSHKTPMHLKVATVAQWALESGRGSSALSKSHVNFAGLKCRIDEPEFANIMGLSCAFYEEGRGESDKSYFKCKDVKTFVDTYWAFLSRPVYKGWEAAVNTAPENKKSEAFIEFLKSKGYAGDAAYVSKVSSLFDEAEQILGTNGGDKPSLKDLKGLRVALDVGHGYAESGGMDPGASGPKISEYELNKLQAKVIKEALESKGASVSVFDYSTPSAGLTLAAKGSKAKGHHIFVSLHHNSVASSAQGSEVLIEDDKWTIEDTELATFILAEIIKFAPEVNTKFPYRGVKKQGLGVLSGAHNLCRAKCLTESYFISHPDLNRTDCISISQKAAKGIANGIALYAKENGLTTV